jgi:hypothetical protein
MSFSAVIQAELSANSTKFRSELNNASTQVSKLEQQMRAAGALPLPGERSARDSASVFAAQADSVDKVTAARYRAMEAAKAEESAIRANIRAREEETAAASRSTGTAPSTAPATAAGGGLLGRFSNWRKGAMKSLTDIGASDLVKGLGVGALVAGFKAALDNAQSLRDTAYETGSALDPAVARTAELADTLDRAKQGAMNMVATLVGWVQSGVDRAVAGTAALFGMGSYGENLSAIEEGRAREEQAARAIATEKKRKEAAEEAAKAELELAEAQAEVAKARYEQSKAQLSTEEKIALAERDVADAQSAVNEEKADTVDRAKAELEVINRQNDLLDLRKQREEELAEIKKKAAEEQEQMQKRLNDLLEKEQAARAKVADAQRAYQQALSDQSAASLADVQAGTRGSARDQRTAAEVARLRQRAQQARDTGSSVVIGGQTVSVADQLSTRANQLQSTIGSLSTAERNPLAGVEEQLKAANEELSQIRESLELMEIPETP